MRVSSNGRALAFQAKDGGPIPPTRSMYLIGGIMSFWNYRVFKKEYLGEISLDIHETYYNDNLEITMISKAPISPFGCGYNVNEAKTCFTNDIKLMSLAIERPILDLDEVRKQIESRV
jgi:hypothetical protein